MRRSVLFLGWLIGRRKVEELRKTELTYLPSIDIKVTDLKTIIMYLEHLQALANSVNMKYVNVTLDCGAAINAFKTICQYPLKFNNVVRHLGDFHFMKENFQVKFFWFLCYYLDALFHESILYVKNTYQMIVKYHFILCSPK